MAEENLLGFKTVFQLMSNDMHYFIPCYQRGYRWDEQQVKELLNDILWFDNSNDAWYSLQPIVVRTIEKEKAYNLGLDGFWYEVIDGQQRLTTLYIIFHCYNLLYNSGIFSDKIAEPVFEYQTRGCFSSFLKNLTLKKDADNSDNYLVVSSDFDVDGNIDFHYVSQVFRYVYQWFINKKNEDISFKPGLFIEKFLHSVRVIWYVSEDELPVKVFTRLNVGKIPLTNAELIKALFLNSSNFGSDDEVRLKQIQIANAWDKIESTLQNDEFWLFLHEDGYKNSTKIDFIFDIVKELDMLDVVKNEFNSSYEEYIKTIGTDDYSTFRYFSCYMSDNPTKKLDSCWDKVKSVFLIFSEWFDDCELYHYIGFLVACNISISTILNEWLNYANSTLSSFVNDYLKREIRNILRKKGVWDLDKQYKYDDSDSSYDDKTVCRPLLLLHNIQSIINQNKNLKELYGSTIFNKFPFNLLKKESWDVEHIDPNTANDFSNLSDRQEYLLNCYLGLNDILKEKVICFLEEKTEKQSIESFLPLKKEIDASLGNDLKETLQEDEKNRVWNFVLLDSGTNRSYGNSIFSGKRRIIIGKDKGVAVSLPTLKKTDLGSITIEIKPDSPADSAFLPPVTRSVFMKYYTVCNTNPNCWTRTDAEAYKSEIYTTLREFLEGCNDESV